MRLCPKSARELGQPLTDQQAREWCERVFDKERCLWCELARKVDVLLEKDDVAHDVGPPKQGMIFEWKRG